MRLAAENRTLRNELEELKAAGRMGGELGRYFTVRGGMSLGMRSNLCHTPAMCMGLAMGQDCLLLFYYFPTNLTQHNILIEHMYIKPRTFHIPL